MSSSWPGFLAAAAPVLPALARITLLLLLALVAVRLLRRASAGTRHVVWLVALAGVLAVPVASRWTLPILPDVSPAVGAPGLGPIGALGGAEPSEASRNPSAADPRGAPQAPRGSAGAELGESDRSSGGATGPVEASAWPSLGTLLFGAWVAGVLVLLGRLWLGGLVVARIATRATELDEAFWQSATMEVADRMGLRRMPRLVRSDEVQMPFVAGVADPVVVLPAESVDWSEERRLAVLVHELAHVRRRDLLGHTLGRIACAVYWFHPLVWIAAYRLRSESERACDDLALRYGATPSRYAEHLLDIVTAVRKARTPVVAIAMARRDEFEGRVLAILDPEVPRRSPGLARTLAVGAPLLGLAALVTLAAPAPASANPDIASLDRAETPGAVPDLSHLRDEDEGGGASNGDPQPSESKPSESVGSPFELEGVEPSTPAQSVAAPADTSRRAVLLADLLRTDPSAEARRLAAWGLEPFSREEVARSALRAAVASDADARVREMSAWALHDVPPGTVTEALVAAATGDSDAAVRATAAWTLGAIGERGLTEALTPVLSDEDDRVRSFGAWAIGTSPPPAAPRELLATLYDPDPSVRLLAAWALYRIEDPATASPLAEALARETVPRVRVGILRALGELGEIAVPILEEMITSSDGELRESAIQALAGGGAGGPWPWPWPRPRPSP